MEETIKPETRCECRGDAHAHPSDCLRCTRDAVRMVTVPRNIHGHTIMGSERWKQVPMCGPCAEYHEAKAGAGK